MPNYIRVKQLDQTELSGFFNNLIDQSPLTGILANLIPTQAVGLTGNQSISGNKTFNNNVSILGDLTVSGNIKYNEILDTTITGILSGYTGYFDYVSANNLVYNVGDQNISGVKTFYSRPKLGTTGFLISGDSAEYIFTGDLVVSLTNNKTFGRYTNGQTIPASGKTTSQVLQLALVEPIPPTISFTSPTTIAFKQTPMNNVLNASHTINSLGASVYTGYIEWRRGGVGSWSKLTGTTSSSFSFTHSLTDTNFNPSGFNYRYAVVDTISGENTGTLTITPASYVAPSLSSESVGSSTADLGDVYTTLEATINRNSANVNLVSYQLQYQSVIGGVTSSWTNIGSSVSISGPSYSFSTVHNDLSLVDATSISYRVQVTDQYQTTTLTLGTRSFLYSNYLGYSSSSNLTTVAQVELLSSYPGSAVLSNSKTRTVSAVTAGAGEYTYYAYRAAEGDLTSIIQDGAAPVLGAFSKISDIVGTNVYGASVTYRVYKSNATSAFTNNTLAFS